MALENVPVILKIVPKAAYDMYIVQFEFIADFSCIQGGVDND